VKSIVTYDGELDEAFAPQAVTITLADEIDVSRGDVLVQPHALPHVSSRIEAMVVWLNEKPFVAGRSYWIKHMTRTVSGELAELRHAVNVNTLEQAPASQLEMNEVGRVVLSLSQPIAFDAYKDNSATGAFILIDRLTNNTVGAGMIVRPADSISNNLTWHEGDVTRADRERLLGQRGKIIWMTGLSGSGKSTIACRLEQELLARGKLAYRLDGDNIRHGLNSDLGFSPEDRAENIRRVGEVARLFADTGVIVIVSFISPYCRDRDAVRACAAEGDFIEVYIKASLDAVEQRDPKGLYKKARAGLIKGFTGINDPYEPPVNPELVIDTEARLPDDAARLILERVLEP
jgi:bifunctional enzyme CysN/CysC